MKFDMQKLSGCAKLTYCFLISGRCSALSEFAIPNLRVAAEFPHLAPLKGRF